MRAENKHIQFDWKLKDKAYFVGMEILSYKGKFNTMQVIERINGTERIIYFVVGHLSQFSTQDALVEFLKKINPKVQAFYRE